MKSTIKGLLTVILFSIISLSAFAQPPASWSYNVTGTNHTILLQATTVINVDGTAVPYGSFVGVFYTDFSGNLQCGGYQEWIGISSFVAAWGDDGLTTTIKEGFADGDEFVWKIYTGGLEYDAVATYMPTMPNSNTFSGSSMSGVLTLNANSVLNVNVVEWLTPMTSCGLSSTETVTVSFSNDTLGNITDPFSVMYSLDGGANWVTETYTGGVTPYDTVTYTFTQTADFSAFANATGSLADSTYSVMFQVLLPGDIDSTDNEFSYTVVNMVPPYTQISGIATDYCLYDNIQPINLVGVPAGGTYTGNGVINGTFFGSFAGPGNHCIVYTYYDAGTGCNGADTVCVNLHSVPITTIGGYTSLNSCQYDTINLVGNYPGGTFYGTPFVNPTTGVFNPLISGNFEIQYAYTDANGCADTSDIYLFHTNPLPSVTINNLSRSYCADQTNIVLNGNPTGGTFSVDGSVLPSNIFNPNTVSTSVHSLGYIFTDANGCTDDFNINVKVWPLPNVSYTGLDPDYCQFDNAVTLTGAPLGGSWTGTTMDNLFDPVTAGVFSIAYSYIKPNQYYGDTAYCENTSTHFTTVHALPVIDLTSNYPTLPNGDIETANTDTVEFNAGPGFTDYLWNTGETTQIIDANYDWGYNVLGYGGYVVTVTNTHGCNGIDSVFVGGTDVKMVDALSPVSNCTLTATEPVILRFMNNGTHKFVTGDKFKLKADLNGINTISQLLVIPSDFSPGDTLEYQLTTPLTNIGILANEGTYTLNTEVKYQNGLNIPDVKPSNDGIAFEIINGGIPVVDLGNDFTTSLPDTVVLDAGEFATYIWNTGANTQTIMVDLFAMTNYCVTVHDQFGCEAEGCITVLDVVELAESFNKINLFPNPNNGQFTLVVENKTNSDIKYDLVDVRGNVIFTDTKYSVNMIQEEIELPGLAKGFYFLRVNNGTDINVIKIAVE